MSRRFQAALLIAACVALTGCVRGCPSSRPPIHLNPNMDLQPKAKAQSESHFFYDGQTMRKPVPGTVARGELTDDSAYFTGLGPDGELADFEITYTFGVEPLQQYLVEFPGGRLQCLTIAWDTERGRWFHLYPDERIPPDDELHWTGRYQRWNAMCAECHSTELRKNYDPETDTYATTWHEIDVGCQACHGPGGAHVEWARSWQAEPGETTQHLTARDKGLAVSLRRGEPATAGSPQERCYSVMEVNRTLNMLLLSPGD